MKERIIEVFEGKNLVDGRGRGLGRDVRRFT